VIKKKTKNVSKNIVATTELDLESIKRMAEKCPELVGYGFHGCGPLDYSIDSLRCLDEVIDTLRVESVDWTSDTADRMVLTFGCYAGEVLVRVLGGSWVNVTDQAYEMVSFHGWAVKLAQGLTNPISKAFKRFKEGDEHSLHIFALACKKICVDGMVDQIEVGSAS